MIDCHNFSEDLAPHSRLHETFFGGSHAYSGEVDVDPDTAAARGLRLASKRIQRLAAAMRLAGACAHEAEVVMAEFQLRHPAGLRPSAVDSQLAPAAIFVALNACGVARSESEVACGCGVDVQDLRRGLKAMGKALRGTRHHDSICATMDAASQGVLRACDRLLEAWTAAGSAEGPAQSKALKRHAVMVARDIVPGCRLGARNAHTLAATAAAAAARALGMLGPRKLTMRGLCQALCVTAGTMKSALAALPPAAFAA